MPVLVRFLETSLGLICLWQPG